MTKSAPILLVEDDNNDICLLQVALHKSGLPNSLRLARNGEEAIRYLELASLGSDPIHYPMPGLLLLDLKMPELDGFGLLAWLQSRSDLAPLPVVVLTASPHHKDMHKAHQLGVTDYQLKPAGFDDLVRLIHEIHARWMDQGPQ